MSEATENQPEGTTEALAAFSPADQASIEKGQQGLSPPPNPNVQPTPASELDGIPAQFIKDGKVDYAALAKGYNELRTKMDGKPADALVEPAAPEGEAKDGLKVADKVDQPKEGEGGEPAANPVVDALESARTEWAETGELTDDTIAAIEAQGIPRPIIDSYLAGVRLQQQAIETSIYDAAGGKDAYNQATTWAAKNLTPAEIEKFDSALDDEGLRTTAVAGLMARYKQANPSEGRIISPSDAPAAGGDVFASRDELVAAQKDPRYQTDAAYRQSVMDKLVRSQNGGFAAFDRPLFGKQSFSS